MDLFGIFSAMMDVQRSWEDRPLELARKQTDLLLKLQEATTEELRELLVSGDCGSRAKAPVNGIPRRAEIRGPAGAQAALHLPGLAARPHRRGAGTAGKAARADALLDPAAHQRPVALELLLDEFLGRQALHGLKRREPCQGAAVLDGRPSRGPSPDAHGGQPGLQGGPRHRHDPGGGRLPQ